ncbi:hypothetical protein [Priestia megaterium]|uniref:hypothetical protein n=1 Tax=Priestia megaterium TaxID=1404 RepID=UPI000BFDBB83|nr:hypothetical protein [Priestia megaterium]PGX73131.1 hypothetical protein COE31_23495 [Priestia megaterium]
MISNRKSLDDNCSIPCINDCPIEEQKEVQAIFPVDDSEKKSDEKPPKPREKTFIEPTTLSGKNYIKLAFPQIKAPTGTKPDDWSWFFEQDTDDDKKTPSDECPKTKGMEIPKTLLFIPTYQLSSFLGKSGSGRLLNTFTLLPGEESNITIRTFSRTSTTENKSTSIVDSYSEETENRFLQERKEEDWSLKYREENETTSAKAGGQGIWGWGSASASGSWSRDTHTKRTDFSYNLMNTVENHTQKASSSRNIQVGTSSETQNDKSKFESVERKLKNVNLDRVLNYKFYQLNQEYHSVLHLTGVQVGYMKKEQDKQLILEQYSIEDLDRLLEKRVQQGYRNDVKEGIQEMLLSFIAYPEAEIIIAKDQNPNTCGYTNPLEGKLKEIPIIELTTDPDDPNKKFPRFIKKRTTLKYHTDENEEEFCIDGYIVNLTTQILRTDGVRIEPKLGAGGALDAYEKNKQNQQVWSQYLDNRMKLALINKEEKIKELIDKVIDDTHNNDKSEKARIVHLLYNCLADHHALIDTKSKSKDDEQPVNSIIEE